MKALLQRVRHASVVVDGEEIGAIKQGLLVFLGVGRDDDEAAAQKLLKRVLGYRIFADDDGRMNLSVRDIEGELLIVSQFTLMADTQKGMRPGFSQAGAPDVAEQLYEYFVAQARETYQSDKIATGQFAADMQISLLNDGPVTFMLDV